MNVVTSFDELAARVFELHGRGAYREALDLVDREGSRFPREAWQVAYWRLCLLACLGEVDEALAHFERVLDAGLWFPLPMLRHDRDLAELQGDPRFEQLVAACEQRREEAQKRARPVRVVLTPDNSAGPMPLLIVLHGNAGTVESTAEKWRSAVDHGWAVLLPQSSQVMGPDAYAWTDLERGMEEVLEHFLQVRTEVAVDEERVVVGGFSRGAGLAVHLALSGRLPVRGLIAVAPHLPQWQELKTYIEQHRDTGVLKDVAGFFVVGAGDEWAVRLSEEVAGSMRQAGLSAQVIVQEGLGHFYPEDLPRHITEALSGMPWGRAS